MIALYNYITSIIGSRPLLFCAISISFYLKCLVFGFLFIRGFRHKAPFKPLAIALILVASSILVDFSWVAWLMRSLFLPAINYKSVLFLIRISWAFSVVQYQSLALFVESLIEKHYRISRHQFIFIFISSLFCLFFLSIAFIHYDNTNPDDRPAFEYFVEKISTLYLLGPLMMTTLIITIRKIYQRNLPRILKKQLKIIFKYIIAPYLVSDFIQLYPFSFSSNTTGNFAMVALSSALLTFAIYYCSRQIMGLRFLNIHNHVQSYTRFNFIQDFKDVLEQLSQVTTVHELTHINQLFFKNAFGIPPSSCFLYIRNHIHAENDHKENIELSKTEAYIEEFIGKNPTLLEFLQKTKIILTDELTFNNFYDETEQSKIVITFLNHIEADIFIPIFKEHTIIASIIINNHARAHTMFSNVDQDEMLVFSSYLGNIINLLQNRNLTGLLFKEKRMQEDLYTKHQELNHYKESINSFVKDAGHHKIGIIFYKNRRFIYGNKEAHDLINFDINKHEGHPLAQSLQHLVSQVETFKIAQNCITLDSKGNRLVCSCIPNLEQNNLIITIFYPEVSDIIKQQLELLKNPVEWEYLLYLETTQIGKKISHFIPCNTQTFLNIKIDLLKHVLSKKALLIQAPYDDLIPVTELLHEMSLRQTLHVLNLKGQDLNNKIAKTLFGINPSYEEHHDKPLLSTLDKTGTLFIQNIEYLNRESQEILAEYIHYGYYYIFKTHQKVFSNVRIICSSAQNLSMLTQEKAFSENLFKALQNQMLVIPPLNHSNEDELIQFAESYLQQHITDKTFKNFFILTPSDKQKLCALAIPSITLFKQRIQQLIEQKSKGIDDYIPAVEAHALSQSPQLITAARLGKKALQDPEIMRFLWQNFKNQNKMATFLGVNRSSINRRCKEYNLE